MAARPPAHSCGGDGKRRRAQFSVSGPGESCGPLTARGAEGSANRTSGPAAFAKRRVPAMRMRCKSSALHASLEVTGAKDEPPTWKVPLNGRQLVLKTRVGIVSQGFDSSTLCQSSRSSIGRIARFEREGCWFESSRECHFHARVVQRQRQPAQTRSSVGSNAFAPLRSCGVQFPPPETGLCDARDAREAALERRSRPIHPL